MSSVVYSANSLSVLKKMPAKDAERIRAKIRQYADDPSSLQNNVRSLTGRPGLRLRIGDWRVLFTVDAAGDMKVLDIGPRGSIYG